MYVKKFEGETLDEALKSVKLELGPDAIILKTVTNKGLKGAFKKSRIEVTAAISEQSYEKKAKVDKVLTSEQKDDFYNKRPATEVSNQIENYNGNQSGYGPLGLNKVVNSVSKAGTAIKNSLDDFLMTAEESLTAKKEEEHIEQSRTTSHAQMMINETPSIQTNEEISEQRLYNESSSELTLELKHQLKSQNNKIEALERRLKELSENSSQTSANNQDANTEEHLSVGQLRVTLKTLDLSEGVIQKIIKKATFELSKDQLADSEVIYEFALRELSELINVEMPLFSSINIQEETVVTALLSDGASGQTSMAVKLAVLQEDVTVIRYCADGNSTFNHSLASQVFDLDVKEAKSVPELLTFSRKASEEGRSVILDIKVGQKQEETRKIVEALRRSFKNLEVLITISAINSELYNRKILSKYKEFGNGVIISYIDQCMSYGSVVNVHYANSKLPLKFFGTGPVVPDDVEAASAERILAGMFDL